MPTATRKPRGPNRVRICPLCSGPVKSRQSWVSLGAVRHHLSCAREAGLVRETRGRPVDTARSADDAVKISLRLSAVENAHAVLVAFARRVTIPELCRRLLAGESVDRVSRVRG